MLDKTQTAVDIKVAIESLSVEDRNNPEKMWEVIIGAIYDRIKSDMEIKGVQTNVIGVHVDPVTHLQDNIANGTQNNDGVGHVE